MSGSSGHTLRASLQKHTDTRIKFPEVERLHHIVVDPGIKAFELVVGRTESRKH